MLAVANTPQLSWLATVAGQVGSLHGPRIASRWLYWVPRGGFNLCSMLAVLGWRAGFVGYVRGHCGYVAGCLLAVRGRQNWCVRLTLVACWLALLCCWVSLAVFGWLACWLAAHGAAGETSHVAGWLALFSASRCCRVSLAMLAGWLVCSLLHGAAGEFSHVAGWLAMLSALRCRQVS